ncbi:MAG: hypothetical protein IKW00_03010 [Clostridia bacterium]|nr:hypothetical protein [Clostridia bacterium]
MHYAYQLKPHQNARYQQSLFELSRKELECMLLSCGINVPVTERVLGGTPFLCFECDTLPPAAAAFLAAHSGLYLAAELKEDLLRPLSLPRPDYLPPDMPDILKYKGKTNTAFTHLMINLALAAGEMYKAPAPCILDPICGHGTTLFCALTRGMNAVGIDSDRKSITEGAMYAQKWLQQNRVKHTCERTGRTVPGGKNAPETHITALLDEKRSVSFLLADTRSALHLMRKKPAHALVADLPYCVQHAPTENGRMSTLETLLSDALPAWRQSLLPGAAAAISFNTYTLKRHTLQKLMEDAGFTVLTQAPYDSFEHWVEQAVNRDVIVALNPKK